MLPFELMATITALWVLIGAVLVMPHFVNKKINRKGGTVDKIENRVIAKIDAHLDTKFAAMDIPTKTQINDFGNQVAANMNRLQDNMPKLLHNYIASEDFGKVIQSYEGRIYRAKGVEIDKLKKLNDEYIHGMQAAEKVYIDKVQNGNDNSELALIMRDALEIAEQSGFIEEGSTEQKMGLIHGVLRLMHKLQNRDNGSTPPKIGGGTQRPHNFNTQGSELDTYYR